jgi:hypothetical protein
MGSKIARMQKKASVFMKDPKKKMREWWDKWWDFWEDFKFDHPWKARSLQYGVLALVILIAHILFGILSDMFNVDYFRYPLNEAFRYPFNLTANLTINRTPNMQETEIYVAEMYADNARSILCALVGSEAAIVAIVVSLTLIAIELTASAYSPRVIKISLKNPDMWILLGIYGGAIFSSILILKQLPYESWFPTEDLSLAFWLGVFSYAALVPYLRNIPQLLDPTNIVRRVSADIEKDKLFLKYIKDLKEANDQKETSKEDEKNPIRPLLDIVYRSISNYDLETVRNALGQIVELAKIVINEYSPYNAPGKDNEKLLKKQKRFLKDFCDPLRRISRLAASKDDEESTIVVIKTLQTFGEETAGKRLNFATERVADTLAAVGKISAGKGKAFKDAVKEVAKSLEELGKAAAKENLNDAVKQVALTLGDVGAIYAGKGKELEDAVTQTASSLGAVGKLAAEKGKGFDEATGEIAKALGAVGVSAAGSILENVTQDAVKNLLDIGNKAKEKELKYAPKNVISSLTSIGAKAAEKKLEFATLDTVSGLDSFIDAKFEPRMSQIARALQAVGEATIENDLEEPTKTAVCSLLRLKKLANNENLNIAINDADKCINELLTKSKNEIVKIAIDKCK